MPPQVRDHSASERWPFRPKASRVALEGWLTADAITKLFKAAGQEYAALKAAAAKRDFKPVAIAAKATVTLLFGEEDRNIPKELEHYMAERAHARRTIEIPGGSHAITVSHPEAVAHQILDAAAVQAVA